MLYLEQISIKEARVVVLDDNLNYNQKLFSVVLKEGHIKIQLFFVQIFVCFTKNSCRQMFCTKFLHANFKRCGENF